jgi:hypothetical protein
LKNSVKLDEIGSFERLLKRLEATEAFDIKNAGINESVSVNSDSSLDKVCS